MINEAIDKETGKKVKVKETKLGQPLECPYCGVDGYPVLDVKNPFFRCYKGGKHTHYLCEQLEKSNRAYDPKLIDIEQLFANLFRPVEDRVAPVIPPAGGDGPEEEPKTDDLGTEPGTEPNGGGDEEGDTGREEEPDDDEDGKDDEPPEPVILPCRTLSQLWKAGIYKLGPSELIGSCLRSDIFLWYRDFDKFFARRETLGKRVHAVRPLWPVNRANAILFVSFSSIRGSKEHKKKYFVLEFQERKEYNKACKKLFILNTKNSGTSRPASKYDMVLVAGNWTELDEEEYAAFSVKPGEHIYGVQSSHCWSKKQIYPIPQYKSKNNGLTTKTAE